MITLFIFELLTYKTAPELIEHEFIAGNFKEIKLGGDLMLISLFLGKNKFFLNVPENVEKHLIDKI